MPRLVPNMDKEIAQNLKLILKKRGVESHTLAAVQGVHMEGDTCVCTFVEKEKVDLLAMTTRRRNVFARLFNPGLAHKMIFHSDTPLLVIPASGNV